MAQLALFDFFDLALNRRSGHSCSSFSVLTAFNHLAGTKDGFILIAQTFSKIFLYITRFSCGIMETLKPRRYDG